MGKSCIDLQVHTAARFSSCVEFSAAAAGGNNARLPSPKHRGHVRQFPGGRRAVGGHGIPARWCTHRHRHTLQVCYYVHSSTLLLINNSKSYSTTMQRCSCMLMHMVVFQLHDTQTHTHSERERWPSNLKVFYRCIKVLSSDCLRIFAKKLFFISVLVYCVIGENQA